MDYGFVSKNINGEVQIDSDFRNYAFAESGTAFPDITAFPGRGVITFPSVTATPPLVAVKPPSVDYPISLFGLKKDSLGKYSGVLVQLGKAEQQVDWLKCVLGTNDPLPDYGMVIQNGGGDVVFNSNSKYLKILGVNAGYLPRDNSSYIDFKVSNTSNYFILSPWYNAAGRVEYRPDANGYMCYYLYRGICRLDSTTVRITNREVFLGLNVFGSYPLFWSDNFTLIECSI